MDLFDSLIRDVDKSFFNICSVQISCSAFASAVELFICLKVFEDDSMI